MAEIIRLWEEWDRDACDTQGLRIERWWDSTAMIGWLGRSLCCRLRGHWNWGGGMLTDPLRVCQTVHTFAQPVNKSSEFLMEIQKPTPLIRLGYHWYMHKTRLLFQHCWMDYRNEKYGRCEWNRMRFQTRFQTQRNVSYVSILQ